MAWFAGYIFFFSGRNAKVLRFQGWVSAISAKDIYFFIEYEEFWGRLITACKGASEASVYNLFLLEYSEGIAPYRENYIPTLKSCTKAPLLSLGSK